ncbi:MAG TPA: hypothetical protein VGU64_14265, partial [Terriglobales bacterium]|nr:hypothetical protein [Terriglobales bacterium]
GRPGTEANIADRTLEMLTPSQSGPRSHKPLRQTLLAAAAVIGATILGAVILCAVTDWLWLVVHQGLR